MDASGTALLRISKWGPVGIQYKKVDGFWLDWSTSDVLNSLSEIAVQQQPPLATYSPNPTHAYSEVRPTAISGTSPRVNAYGIAALIVFPPVFLPQWLRGLNGRPDLTR